jgi:heptosyltransferase-2
MTSNPGALPNLFESVAIRTPNWLGDAVMAVPALRELRRIFGRSRLTLLVRPALAGLFDDQGIADQIISIEDTGNPWQRISGFISGIRRLRREPMDLTVLLPNSFSSAFMARAAGSRRIAGYPTDRRSTLLNLVIPLDRATLPSHLTSYYLNIALQLERRLSGSSTIEIESGVPSLQVGNQLGQSGREFLGRHGIDPAKPIAAINPGATNSRAKQWLAERFAQTADILARSKGFQTVVIGTAGDAAVARTVVDAMETPASVLAGRTSLADLKAILSCCSLVVSNDTGAAHLASALGVPTVVIFGPTEHHSTRPLSELAAVVRREVECSPCMLRDCPIDHRCMTGVTVDDVCARADELIVISSRSLSSRRRGTRGSESE